MKIFSGIIRLVNPWRGLVYCCNMPLKEGRLIARASGVTGKEFERWEIFRYYEGIEYICGRSFTRKELSDWVRLNVLGAEDLPQEDLLGSIPAQTSNPQDWRWYGFSIGECILPEDLKPTVAQFQQLSLNALQMSGDRFYPLLDNFEIWVCDKESFEPIALVSTAVDLKSIDYQVYSPMVRLDYDFKDDNYDLYKSLEAEINSAINASNTPKKSFGYFSLLVKRKLDGSAVAYKREDPNDNSLPLKPTNEQFELPSNWLASPYWEKYQSIVSRDR